MSHGRLLRWRSNRGGPIAWVACFHLRAIPLIFFSTNCDAEWGLKSRKSRQHAQHVDLIPQYAAERLQRDQTKKDGPETFGPSKKANHRSTTGPQVTAIEGINIDRGWLKSQEECHDAQSIFPVDPGCARTTESLGARH
jgi:hypothetical protein